MDSSAPEANLRNVLKTFAGEVFDFFSSNVKIWQQNPESLPLYDLFLERKNVSFFHSQMKKGVITLTYLFRNECREQFRQMSDDLKEVENYENYAISCSVPKDNYLSHFLAWIAFILELTTYCYTEGYDYSEAGQRCLEKYPDMLRFSEEGGWEKVYETSDLIAVFYDPLIASFYGKFPESDILAPFLRALDDIFRFDEYENKHLQIKRFRDIESRRLDQSAKIRAVLPYDPQIIRFGCLVTKKNECPDKSKGKRKVCSPKSENATIQIERMKHQSKREDIKSNVLSHIKSLKTPDDGASMHLEDERDYTVGNVASIASAVSNLSLVPSVNDPRTQHMEFDYTNSVFVITDRYLKKRQKIMKKVQKSKCKVDIKVYSPTKKMANVVEKLDEILEHNIDKNNISSITDDVLTVGPPEWNDKCDDYRLIVLNSSSEEEDDEFDSSQRSVLLHVLKDWSDLAPCHIMTMKLLVKSRVWEPKSENTSLNVKISNTNESSGTRVKAILETKMSGPQLPGPSKTNAAGDSSSDANARDLQLLDRKKSGTGQKKEWRKKPVLRN